MPKWCSSVLEPKKGSIKGQRSIKLDGLIVTVYMLNFKQSNSCSEVKDKEHKKRINVGET